MISAATQKIINKPTGIDNKTNNDLSLFLKIDIIPKIKPITPNVTINSDGNGSRIEIAKNNNFIIINTIKSNVNIDAHFPVFSFDQN
ncbi:MAG: hypothetical protein PHO63_02845 [Bacilli bacterium]|nr:hypothetical protein [Bacilli bacterium]MDD4808947.1 hypothetical protein [Bacilli bacterium]